MPLHLLTVVSLQATLPRRQSPVSPLPPRPPSDSLAPLTPSKQAMGSRPSSPQPDTGGMAAVQQASDQSLASVVQTEPLDSCDQFEPMSGFKRKELSEADSDRCPHTSSQAELANPYPLLLQSKVTVAGTLQYSSTVVPSCSPELNFIPAPDSLDSPGSVAHHIQNFPGEQSPDQQLVSLSSSASKSLNDRAWAKARARAKTRTETRRRAKTRVRAANQDALSLKSSPQSNAGLLPTDESQSTHHLPTLATLPPPQSSVDVPTPITLPSPGFRPSHHHSTPPPSHTSMVCAI